MPSYEPVKVPALLLPSTADTLQGGSRQRVPMLCRMPDDSWLNVASPVIMRQAGVRLGGSHRSEILQLQHTLLQQT